MSLSEHALEMPAVDTTSVNKHVVALVETLINQMAAKQLKPLLDQMQKLLEEHSGHRLGRSSSSLQAPCASGHSSDGRSWTNSLHPPERLSTNGQLPEAPSEEKRTRADTYDTVQSVGIPSIQEKRTRVDTCGTVQTAGIPSIPTRTAEAPHRGLTQQKDCLDLPAAADRQQRGASKSQRSASKADLVAATRRASKAKVKGSSNDMRTSAQKSSKQEGTSDALHAPEATGPQDSCRSKINKEVSEQQIPRIRTRSNHSSRIRGKSSDVSVGELGLLVAKKERHHIRKETHSEAHRGSCSDLVVMKSCHRRERSQTLI